MIRSILFSTALLAIAGGAQAAAVKVVVTGKTEAQIKADVSSAAKLACHDVSIPDYYPCVVETTQNALADVAKLRATKLTSNAF